VVFDSRVNGAAARRGVGLGRNCEKLGKEVIDRGLSECHQLCGMLPRTFTGG
jgi:hypothetical protein